MNAIIGGQVANAAQQAIVAVGPRVVTPFAAGVILTISTVVAGVIALGFGIKAMFECRLGDCLDRKVIVQIPMALFVGGVNFAISKLLNLPFPRHISIPLTMAIFFIAANILEEVIIESTIPYPHRVDYDDNYYY
jgi:hypothetical protein